MMRSEWLLIGLTACSSSSGTGALLLTTCGKDTCSFPADGLTTIPVTLCIPGADPLPSPLSLTLVVSRGSWERPSDPSSPRVLTVSLGGIIRCAYANAVAPADLAPLFIDASLAGSPARACVQMTAPPIDRLLLSSMPPTLSFQQPTTLVLSAAPFGPAGASVPASTEITFSIPDITPGDAKYSLQPQPPILAIGASGTATASVVTEWNTTSITVRAEAAVPQSPTCPSDAGATDPDADAAVVTTTLTVPLLPPPPDAGVPDAATSDAGMPDASM